MDNQDLKEKLSDHKLLPTTECSIQKSIKPFVEVISESAATSTKSEQNLGQIEVKMVYGSQNILDHHKKEVSV